MIATNGEILGLSVSLKVDLNTRDAFQKMVQELKTIVAKEGPLKVLTYESYFKGQGSEECLITETYANEEAFKTHLSLIEPVVKKYNISIDVIGFTFFGNVSEETLNMLGTAYGNKFNYYNYRV
jgi:hypothetical protein